jgi:CubicO group peptidase (beta-lactamase class C family)
MAVSQVPQGGWFLQISPKVWRLFMMFQAGPDRITRLGWVRARARVAGAAALVAVAGLVVSGASSAAPATPSTVSATTPTGAPGAASFDVEEYLDGRADEVAGVGFAELRDGEVVGTVSYGLANIETGLEVDQDTVFEWASISKLVVWVSVMQLVEQGQLDLDTSPSRHRTSSPTGRG